MISIIDYGIGNVGSVRKALARRQIEASVASRPEEIERAKKLILPGVGHFGAAMRALNESGFAIALKRRVLDDGVPILGICLGMQLLTSHSDEGNAEGFGWIPGRTIRFEFHDRRRKIPHVGWNSVTATRQHPLLADIESDDLFYFVHSYFVRCEDRSDVIGQTAYGEIFDSCIQRGNIMGVQFHPEKSQGPGLTLLKRFCEGCV